MSSRTWLRVCLSAFLLAIQAAAAQDESSAPLAGPKIGLVLEGGAALGLAHIGVIRWLEEHRIPVSYVAGTSMGGLVGGLYATGNSPDEIRKLVDGIDWDVVLSGEVPFKDLAYRRKEDAEEFPNGLEFGIKKGIQFPSGFNSGHQVGLILDSIALPYSGVKSFDDLPIPFACVATDLVNNKQHVFRDGPLATALRSTMSLPGVFIPVRAYNTVLVDGGLLDNIPVDVAKNMGAEVTIGVHLATKPLAANEPISSFGVLGQSISTVIAANELRSMQLADILIRVPLENYTGMDYKKGAEIIKLGYEAAQTKASVLSRFSVDEATWQAYMANRNARRKTVPTPQFIEATGTKPILTNQIQEALSDHVGKPLDEPQLDQDLTRLLGNGRYASVGYQMVEKNGQPGLQIIAREKDFSPPEVRPLVIIDGGQLSQVEFMLGARITFFDIGKFGSEWRNDVVIGSAHELRTEFYEPFGKKLRWFVAPRGYIENLRQDVFQGTKLIAEYRNRQGGGAADFGFVPARNSELRVGYEAAAQKLYPAVGGLAYGTLEGRVGITSARLHLDGRNAPVIPTAGLDLLARGSWYDANPGATSGFPLAETRITKLFPLNQVSSVFATAAGGSTFTYHHTGFPPFMLGGGPDLWAYGRNEFLTNQYALFRAGYMHSLWTLPPLVGGRIWVFGIAEGAKLYDLPISASTLPGDFAAALVMNTLFGPVEIGGAIGATGHYKFFYKLGRVF
jgi:NTE family protein